MNPESLANDLLRSYNYARRFIGVPWSDDEGDWILSRPEFPDDRLADLAGVILDPQPSRHALARAIGARELLHVTPGKLGKAEYHLGRLGNRELIRELIDEGVRPLRSMRGQDFEARLGECVEAVRLAATGPWVRQGHVAVAEALFGADGLALAEAFEEALEPGDEVLERQTRRLADFVTTAQHLALGEGPPRPELRELWTTLAKLPEAPERRARGLLGVFRGFVAKAELHRIGRRRSLEAAIRGRSVDEAAAILVELVKPEPSAATESPAWSEGDRCNLMELALRLRSRGTPLPRKRGETLETLVEIGRETDAEVLEILWPQLIVLDHRALVQARWALRRTKLDPALVAEAMALGLLVQAQEFEDDRSFRAYLRAARHLREHPIAHLDPSASWFVEPFRSSASWEAPFVLGLLATRHDEPETLVATLLAARSSGFAELGFAEALARWEQPMVDARPTEFDELVARLGRSPSELDRYLHWRRLTGHGETFSDTITRPLRLEVDEARELEHLRTLPQTPTLDQRISRLEDVESRGVRLDAACRRAAKAFERALEVLRRESLDAVVEQTARGAFEQLLGRPLHGPLPARTRSLMLLVGAENIDIDALRSFVEDVLDRRILAERPANAQWLRELATKGVDVERWLAGVDLSLDVHGEVIRFSTEHDPLHVLEMGSYFDTCLSLDGGFNAASTLTNALDVNKQVLYGRRPDGTVVARKLIAVSDDAALLGYRTYAFEDQAAVDEALSEALVRFGEACGLRPSTEGQPRALHDTFWYDDGADPWRQGMSVPVPADLPRDRYAAAEWAYLAGFEDPEAWRGLAATNGNRWSDVASALHAQTTGDGAGLGPNACRHLAGRGSLDWLGAPQHHPWSQLENAVTVLPADVTVARDYVRRVRAMKVSPATSAHDHMLSPPLALALLSVAEICGHILDHIRIGREARLECFLEDHESCVEWLVQDCATMIQIAGARDGDESDSGSDSGAALERLLSSRDPVVQTIGIEAATRMRSPRVARRLRQLLKERGPNGRLEWAVAAQGDRSSLWQLWTMLESDPHRIEVAAALAVHGPEQLAADARALVVLPDRFTCDAAWVRVLAPETLPRGWYALPDEAEPRQRELSRLLATGVDEAMDRLGPGTQTAARTHAHARRLRDSGHAGLSRCWSEYLQANKDAPDVWPCVFELREIFRAALRPAPDLDALDVVLNSRLIHGAALLPFAVHHPLDDAALTRLRAVRIPSWRAGRFRHFLDLGQMEGAFEACDRWEYEELLGGDEDRWRAMTAHWAEVDPGTALELCEYAMSNLPPGAAEAMMLDLLDGHEAAFIRDAAQLLTKIVGRSPWDDHSYRAARVTLDWAVGRVSGEVLDAWLESLKAAPRHEWLRRELAGRAGQLSR